MSGRNENLAPRAASPSDELHTGPGALTRWLIHQAACRVPKDLSERLEEEWRADVAVRSSVISQLRFALGCCWATRLIVRERSPASIPVTSAAIGPKVAIGYAGEEPQTLARRSITFFLVVGLHIALFYALMTGLTFKIIKVMPTSFQTRLLQAPHERTLPPLPPPQLPKSIIEVPRPDFPPTEGPIESGDIFAEPYSTLAARPETPPATPTHEVLRVQGGPGSGFPNTDDYYPAIAKRMEEEGVSAVHVCVGADGRLTSAPTIAQTSGNPRLDEGALLLAKAGSGHYRAGTEDGRPVSSCYSFRVRFALRMER
jgi:protein TonB